MILIKNMTILTKKIIEIYYTKVDRHYSMALIDIIDPNIDVKYALKIKREIDLSNQNRTDIVEQVDDYFLNLYSDVKIKNAKINTESPACMIDCLFYS